MSIITSPELFINVKKVPGPDSREYKAFFKEERRKVKQGVTINGVYIPGWLYWHVNHWLINIDLPPDPITGYIERYPSKPMLRDNEWLIAEHIHRAEKEHKGLLIIGSRQLGKSEFGASYMGRRAIAFKNTQNIIAGLSEPDLKLLTSKMEYGFNGVHPYFRPTIRIDNNWNKAVTLGYKDKMGNRQKFSEILIRNLDGGDNTENLAGPTTSSLYLDECGKGDFLEALIAARPAMETPYGWRCTPIFTGTSGSFEKSEDLQKFYGQLEAYNFLCIELKEKETGVIRRYIPGYMASKVPRKKVRLSDYLGVARGSELDQTAIHIIRSKEIGEAKIMEDRDKLLKTGEMTLWKKEIMYYPLNDDELFLISEEDDIFADIKEMAKEHLAYLESIELDEQYVWMARDTKSGKVKTIKAAPTEYPIFDYPIKDKDKHKYNFDCCITIWEEPLPGQEYGVLHVSGADPYNQDEAPTSQSLGSFYIYRRTYDPIAGRFQEQFVASYVARPKDINKWRGQVEMLMEYYQATCLPENEEPGFIRHFDNKHKGFWLEDGMDLAKEINPNTKMKRNKGLSASTANIRYGNGLLKQYCKEEIVVGQTPDGENIIKPGIVRIKCRGLLREIIHHKPLANVDRVVGARHALIIANYKDKYFPLAKVTNPTPTREKKKPHTVKPPFNMRQVGGGLNMRKPTPFAGMRKR